MTTNRFSYILWSLLLVMTSVRTASADESSTGFQMSAALDLVSDLYSPGDGEERVFPAGVRSAELMLFSPVDHLFDGMINFAGHTEGGEFFFELHEGYVGSSKLIPSSRFRAGKFFLGVGRLNQLHQHDWSFTTAPKAHEVFFAPEGAADVGIEYTYLLPTEHFIELNFGATANRCYGHCHGAGGVPPRPLLYFRPTTYFELSNQAGMQVGLNYLNRIDAAQIETHLAGVDITFKSREGRRLIWLNQTELFYQSQGSESVTRTKKLGGYHLTQYGLNESWSLGLRLDAFSDFSLRFQTTGERRNDLDYAIVPVVTWKPSEFSTFRLSFTLDVDTTQGDADQFGHRLQLQFSYLMGAHPAHDF